jgi:hypothetical protein
MNEELIDRLITAGTIQEETRLLLETLSPRVGKAAWAAAIPHWFNQDVLRILVPELDEEIEAVYAYLQGLAFVENYQGRGHNIHELTRKVILMLWWNERRSEYRELSKSAERYFRQQEDLEGMVEAAYHLLVTSSDETVIASKWSEIASRVKLSGEFSLGHTLIINAREHISAGRVSEQITKLADEWERSFAGELKNCSRASGEGLRILSNQWGSNRGRQGLRRAR